jgi:hypothetical protein
MSAVTASDLQPGDAVFVHPGESVPDHLRGTEGTVIALEGTEAHLEEMSGNQHVRVKISLLRLDRRRKRRAVYWEAAR